MNLFSKIISYFLGTLSLKLSGEYCERFLNILAANSISFWNLNVKKGEFYITVLRRDIKKIRILRRNTGIKIKIKKRKGFPLIVNKYKYRYGLIVGIVAFFFVLNFLESRVWLIKVNGNEIVSEAEIVDFLNKNNVGLGVAVKQIDTDVLKQKIVLNFKNVAWASLNKQGSVLEVNITEFESKREIESPYNIVASCDGVIKHLDVSKGSVNVKIGDTVFENQILVSGVVNYGYGNNFVQPNGKILAEVKEIKTVNISKIQNRKNYIGKTKNRYSIEIMGLKIPLYFSKVTQNHELIYTFKKIKMFGGEIPIKIHNEKCVFINTTDFILNKATAENIAKNSLITDFEKINAKNVSIALNNIEEKDDEYIFEYFTSCIKEIGAKKIIEFF